MFFASPCKVLHLLSLQMGWGVGELFGSVSDWVFGSVCAKTARNAVRFLLSFFCLEVWVSVCFLGQFSLS